VNQEEQRVAIAEACGWKDADHPDVMKLKHGWTMPEKWCMDPKGVLRFNHDRPNYLNDLNAMHDAENSLTTSQMTIMSQYLHRRLGMLWGFATASQRAEAFLRTIGKWKEAKP
jgi:hypothetical protein